MTGERTGPGQPIFVEDWIVDFLSTHRLEWLGVLALESLKPLSFIGSQACLMGAPFLSMAFRPDAVDSWRAFLSDRRNIERAIRRLESGSGPTGSDPKGSDPALTP